ncbi:MAG TPA: hypothetical protein VMT62_00770 [Syntrophorhabdaceae bacterium]|nr:hypothetical protein [Syntrophorhabdaceae bacterium]
MFYEIRDLVKKNSEAKDRLNHMYDGQLHAVQELIVRLPVIDCSRVIWPISEIWKKGLRDNSRRVGMTVYCDWSGQVSRSFDMSSADSNMLMLDGKEVIRYRSTGKIDDQQLAEIVRTLALLINELP